MKPSLLFGDAEQQRDEMWRRLVSKQCNRIFVLGSDTGVGKTRTTALLANALHDAGRRVAYFKPAETGCEGAAGHLHSAEIQSMLQLAKKALGTRVSCPYRFELPLAPYTAAIHKGVTIRVDRLDSALQEAEKDADVVLIEGAGGLMVPLSQNLFYLDLLERWQVQPILVVGNKLGCVSHALMTERLLQSAGFDKTPVLLNNVENTEPDPAQTSNQWTLEATLGRPLWQALPYNAKELDIFPLPEESIQ